MKKSIGFFLLSSIVMSCEQGPARDSSTSTPALVAGTWQLISGTLIEKGDTVITDYTKNVSFIKIINDTHFAFLKHDLGKGKDSAAAVFESGGGSYSLVDSLYTEHLEYCSAREWEGNDFTFTMTIKGDTLIQSGIETVEAAGISRLNIEKYRRVKK